MSATDYGSSGNPLVDAGRSKAKAIKPKPDGADQMQLPFGDSAANGDRRGADQRREQGRQGVTFLISPHELPIATAKRWRHEVKQRDGVRIDINGVPSAAWLSIFVRCIDPRAISTKRCGTIGTRTGSKSRATPQTQGGKHEPARSTHGDAAGNVESKAHGPARGRRLHGPGKSLRYPHGYQG